MEIAIIVFLVIVVFQLAIVNGNLRTIDNTLEEIRKILDMSAGEKYEHDLEIDDPEEYKRYQNRVRC